MLCYFFKKFYPVHTLQPPDEIFTGDCTGVVLISVLIMFSQHMSLRKSSAAPLAWPCFSGMFNTYSVPASSSSTREAARSRLVAPAASRHPEQIAQERVGATRKLQTIISLELCSCD